MGMEEMSRSIEEQICNMEKYSSKNVKRSYKKLCKIAGLIETNKLRDRIVLVGGWAPCFWAQDKHVGSNDIDLAFKDNESCIKLKQIVSDHEISFDALFDGPDRDHTDQNDRKIGTGYQGISLAFEDKGESELKGASIYVSGIASSLFSKTKFLCNSSFLNELDKNRVVLTKQLYDILCLIRYSKDDVEEVIGCVKELNAKNEIVGKVFTIGLGYDKGLKEVFDQGICEKLGCNQGESEDLRTFLNKLVLS